jgi:4-hydroxy-4-methyl-2-oxoglutarate aldolase
MESGRAIPSLVEGVRSALISDSLDAAGILDMVMRREILPIDQRSSVFGIARTIEFGPSEEYDTADPYGDAINFLDNLQEGDVAIVATANSIRSAFWGELFSAAAKGRGAHGVICDGPVRDTAQILNLNFPVFADGTLPLDYKGRMKVISTHQPVNCGGVIVRSGDFVLGDRDGIAVIPFEKIEEVLSRANLRASIESNVLSHLLAGNSVRKVWDKYRVL